GGVFWLSPAPACGPTAPGAPGARGGGGGPGAGAGPGRGGAGRRSLEAALEALAGQGYPAPLQVIFCLEEDDAAARDAVQGLEAVRRGKAAVVAVPPHPFRTGKGSNLAGGASAALHPWLAWMDADVEPGPGFLPRLCAPLVRPGVGCAFAFPFHRGARGLTAAALALFVNVRGLTDFLPPALSGRRPTFLAGAAVAVRREALESMGGAEALAGRLADDIRLGELLGARGWRIQPARTPAWCAAGSPGPRGFWARLRRWMLGARLQMPRLHAASGLRLGALWALFCLGLGAAGLALAPGQVGPGAAVGPTASPAGTAAVLILGAAAWGVFRAGAAAAVGLILEEASTLRWCWLAPAVDVAWAAAWIGSWFGRSVEWAGVRYRLGPGGTVARLLPRVPAVGGRRSCPR
ncbi:MAG: glycosyltransferase, partial [Acetobacteraceae bacterium]|nr:glycosyltransferase [Acetobacteraceae bacterium]